MGGRSLRDIEPGLSRFAVASKLRRRIGVALTVAALCAAVVIWQIYEMATASVFSPGDAGYVHYLVIGVALVGLVASLLKLVVEN